MDIDLSKVFNESQCQALQDAMGGVKKEVKEAIDAVVSEKLTDQGIVVDEFLGTTVSGRKALAHQQKIKKLKEIWENGGVSPDTNKRYTIADMVQYDLRNAAKLAEDTQFSPDQPLLIPHVVAQFVREAIEPQIVLTNLLQRLQFSAGTTIRFPATSAFYAEEIAEGTEYPEMELEWAGYVEATIGKVGVAVKMSEEMLRYSMWDVMAMHIRKAGDALVRLKEYRVAQMLMNTGTTDFDNSATFTSGRAFDGTLNNTFTLDDLFTMIANAVNEGWTPNALIVNPMAWLVFARDPVMRAFGFANGGQFLQAVQGTPGAAPQWGGSGLLRYTKVTDPTQLATTMAPVPPQLPFSSLRVIVSKDVTYDPTAQTTTIMLCDTSDLGYLVVDEEVTTDEWDDKARDLKKIKFRERYAVCAPIDVRVRKATNVAIAKAYDWDDRSVWQAGTGDLP